MVLDSIIGIFWTPVNKFPLGAYSSDKAKDDAKAYQVALEAMQGQDYWKITAKLEE